jgi:tRNA-dihydrouridine synthase B
MNSVFKHQLHGVDVILAPLAGITDAVFRRICLGYGADMVVTEMISAYGLGEYRSRLRAVRDLDTREGPIAIQIFGADPEIMGNAAAELSALKPRLIDINLGCPVRKVVRRNGGAALLKDLKLLGNICRTVVRRSSVPVSAKIRAGWDDASAGNVCDIARIIQDAGVSVLTVHARSKKQAFKGEANWSLISAVKETVSIPVVGNGDVRTAADFSRMKKETACDAVMIGRGAIGNPWIFSEIRAALASEKFIPPSTQERLGTLLAHLRQSVESLGETLGIITSRKVMAAYARYVPGARGLRSKLLRCWSLSEVSAVIEGYLQEHGFLSTKSGDHEPLLDRFCFSETSKMDGQRC